MNVCAEDKKIEIRQYFDDGSMWRDIITSCDLENVNSDIKNLIFAWINVDLELWGSYIINANRIKFEFADKKEFKIKNVEYLCFEQKLVNYAEHIVEF